MFKVNMGRIDRTVRLIAGLALIPIGLFLLGGRKGNAIGVLVAAFAVLPIVVGATGVCPAYTLLGISTLGRKQNVSKHL